MRIRVFDKTTTSNQRREKYVIKQVESMLAKYSNRLHWVDVAFADANERSTSCQVTTSIGKLGAVVGRSTDERLAQAFRKAMTKADRCMARRIRQRHFKQTHPAAMVHAVGLID